MPLHITRVGTAVFILTTGATLLSAQSSSSSSSNPSGRESTTRSSSSSRTSSLSKGPLPDPALLDGSAMEAEKRAEHGMLGEFEMPGDENAQSDKVGGQGGGGGGSSDQKDQQNQAPKISVSVPGLPDPAAAAQSAAQAAGGGGASGAESSAGGGGPAGAQQSQQPGGNGNNQVGAAGQAGAQPEGNRVGQLVSDGSSGSAGGNAAAAASSKPQQVALGDKAMQIQAQSPAPGVVGMPQQQVGKDVPQQYDARTPGGGSQSAGKSGNQGVEKGRVMPAGI